MKSKYVVVGITGKCPEVKIGVFKATDDDEAETIFWTDFAAGARYPGYDLVLYRIIFFFWRVYITDDY